MCHYPKFLSRADIITFTPESRKKSCRAKSASAEVFGWRELGAIKNGRGAALPSQFVHFPFSKGDDNKLGHSNYEYFKGAGQCTNLALVNKG